MRHYALPGARAGPDLTAWICVVCATRRLAESKRLVWAVTVMRPRCSGTPTARTVPEVTGRNSWLVEVIVAGGVARRAKHGTVPDDGVFTR
jgi:hypothetical protein